MTITLEPDVAALVEAEMQARGVSFERAVNDAVRTALTEPPERQPYILRPRSMGLPAIPLTKALALADDLDDEKLIPRPARET